tara:strand:+ start:246 stop:836 length:591 start_codon:yes stop_codon:yes gene_type:complete
MKKKQRGVQLTLISIGLLLFFLTYLFYPSINKNKLTENQSISEDFDKIDVTDKTTTFESLEYKGLYNFDKSFKVKSKKAYILNKDPDIVYMDAMHVDLYLSDGRIVNITSDKGRYNKRTHDCFFEQNVKATDENTIIFAENLDLLATESSVEIYNSVFLDYATGKLQADKIDYNFETKYFKVSMFDDKAIKMKVIQ